MRPLRPAGRRLRPALLAMAVAAGPAATQQVTLYRCTDAAGLLTVQSQPCPPGSTQREQRVGGVASSPAAAAASTQTAADASGPQAPAGTGTAAPLLDSAALARGRARADAVIEPPRPPPPPLYRCTRREGDRYLSELAQPAARCIPLATVGLDGNPDTGAGQACEVVRDPCEPVAAAGACDAWKDHARQAQTRWRLAHPDNLRWRGEDYARIAAILAASCGD